MAKQAQPLGIAADTANTTSYSLTPTTYPTTGRMILLSVEGTTTSNPTSISGIGLTWTQRSSVSDGSRSLSVWEGTGTVTASGSITATFAANQTGCRLALHQEWDDAGGTPTIRRWGTGTGTSTTPSATLASTDTGDILIGFSGGDQGNIPPYTDATNWSDGQKLGHSSPTVSMRTSESSTLTTSPQPHVLNSSVAWRCIVGEFYTVSGTTYQENGLSFTITSTDSQVDQANRVESRTDTAATTDSVVDTGAFGEVRSMTADMLFANTLDVVTRVESASLTGSTTVESNDSLRMPAGLTFTAIVGDSLSDIFGGVESLSEASVATVTVTAVVGGVEGETETIVSDVTVVDTFLGGGTTYSESISMVAVSTLTGGDVATRVEGASVSADALITVEDVHSDEAPAPSVAYSQWTEGRILWSDRLELDRDRERVSR